MSARILRAAPAALLLSLPGAASAQNVAEVQVAPPSVTIKVGERLGLLATAFDRVGNVIPTVRPIWTSNNVNVARVDNSGTVTGIAGGVAIVEARVGTRRGQAAVQVIGSGGAVAGPPATGQNPVTQPGGPPADAGADPFSGQPPGSGPAAALRIDPPVVYLLPSENTRASPRALRADGSPAAPVRVTWRSLREDVASVDQNGNIVALAQGQGTVQMTSGTLTATAPVVVQAAEIAIQEQGPLILAPGELDTLHVIVPTQNGRLVSPLALSWQSTNPAAFQVTLTGAVRAVAPGTGTLAVAGLLQAKTIEVRVHRAVEAFAVVPKASAEVQVPVTATTHFQATPLAGDNSPVPEARVYWSMGDTTVAGFDPTTGTLTAKKIGRTQLIARGPGQGLQVTWTVNVIAGSLKLAVSRLGLAPGGRYTLRASFADDSGNVLGPATGVTWATDNRQVATVAEDGTITGQGYGKAHVTGTAPGGKTASAEVYGLGEIVVASSRGGRFHLYSIERSNLAQLKPVSADTGEQIDPAFSSDGARIAFVSNRDGNPEIYAMDADGSNVTRLTNDPQVDGHPVFAPDGQTILFGSQRAAGKPQIFSMSADGTGVKQLTQDSVNLAPTISPDGRTIAYVSLRNKNYDIWLMNRDGSNQRQFTRSPQWRESEPHFLKDGTLAYLVERQENGRTVQQVMRADLPTGQITPISGTDLALSSFAVAPAGDLLALVVNAQPENRRNPSYRVYIQPIGSGAAVPVPTLGPEQMITPTFLPLP
jgi:Tol biopolymer transport system component